jgi:type II secretory pathway component GspD/PulD (secretin)
MTPTRRHRPGYWLGLALVVLLGAVTGLGAQEGPRPLRPREVLRNAIDTYKRGDYEAASGLFAQAQQGRDQLEPGERLELETFGKQNTNALKGRQEGAAQIRQAEEAIRTGHTAEASKLLKTATSNQYLSAADRQALAAANARLHAPRGPAPGDAGALLAAARAALKKGDLDGADAFATAAEKAGAAGSWLQPWADTPARIHREVQAARKTSPPVVVKGPAEMPEKKESAWTFPSMKSLFGKETAPTPPETPASVNKSPRDPRDPLVAQGPMLPPPGGELPTMLPPALPKPTPSQPAPSQPTPSQPTSSQPAPVPNGPQLPPSPYAITGPGAAAPPAPRAPETPSLPSAAEKKMLARQMLAQGYKALQMGDLETARKMAFNARDLNVELDRTELGPDQLLQEVHKKATQAAAAAKGTTPADSRALVKEARALLKKNKIDEAEKLCNQAAAVPNAGWGLFEDTPDRLRKDIQTARTQHDREESVKVLAEARKALGKGQYDEARNLAWRAEKLHGSYGPFDFGDRPQKLLAEIARAETKKSDKQRPGASPPEQVAQKNSASPAAQPKGTDTAKVSPDVALRAKAVALTAEARQLEQRGQLVEAQQKAQEAKKVGVIFTPAEDSPEAVMLTLSAKCKGQIQLTLQQVTDAVSSKPGDMARLQQAQTELAAARQMALRFGLDTVVIEQRAAWVQQAALHAGTAVPPPAPLAQAPLTQAPLTQAPLAPAPLAPAPLTQAVYQAGSSPGADPRRKTGLDLLDKARLELKNGNCSASRKLAEEAFDPAFGVQKEAETVLRDIDAEEHAQRLLAAQRSFQAGMDAYVRGDYRRAGSIFANVEIRLLPAQQQDRLREIMATRELQPQGVVLAGHQELQRPGTPAQPPGTAVATDQGDNPLDQVKAMEKVQFEQMYQRNLQAQKSAMELFKAGQEAKAIDALTGQLHQIELARLGPDATRQLATPLEKRLQEFRTLQAQKLLDKERQSTSGSAAWNEGQYQQKIRKQQEQVSELLKQCNALQRDGKEKEALALAHKARELDPDNPAATYIIQTAAIREAQKKYDAGKKENEVGFLDALNGGMGAIPTETDPFKVRPEAIERLTNRAKNPLIAIPQQTRNPKERAIEYRLDQPIHFGFQDTALRDVIDSLGKLSGIPVYPDSLALQEASISLDHPLTMESNGLAMKSALNILLGKMRLTYIVKDEALMITTIDKAHDNFKQVVYPVADLIVPVENHPLEPVNDLNAVLDRHWKSQTAIMNYLSASPVTNPMSLPPGMPVSSFNSGVGVGSFGAASQSLPQAAASYSPVQKRAPGTTMEDLLMDLIRGTISPHTWKEMGGRGSVQYYPLGMALIINQVLDVQEQVADLLAALRRLQDMEIAIEMRLVSVSESFYERIGVDFDVNLRTPINPSVENRLLNGAFTPFGTVNRNLNFENTVFGLTPAGTLTPDLNFPIKPSSFQFSVPPFGGYTAPGLDGGLSLGLAFLSDIQVFMILEAAQGDSRTNIMQAPKITVFNGQTATLTIGTTQFVNLGITPVPINGTVVFVPQNTPLPINVNLTVTPVVSADRRFVRMALAPRMINLISNNIPVFPIQIPIPSLVDAPLGVQIPVGQPVLFTTFMQQPQVSTIAITTTVNVPDGGTVLLGGLKTMSEGRNEAGPPILSKIPYLSRLFRNVGWGRDAQSLMILVTPRIIINEEEEQIFLGNQPPIPRP